jgi:Flp pilus assembly protein TadG
MHRTPSRQSIHSASGRRQRGAAIVEFALVAMIFFTLLIGMMEFGRWMFTLNAANEATRLGARLAVVCSISDMADIKSRMHAIASGIPVANMSIQYVPTGCTADTCQTVNVSLVSATFAPMIPLLGGNYPIPSFSTSLSREYMNSTNNPICP